MWECSSTVVFLESLRDGLTLISRQNGLTLASRSRIVMNALLFNGKDMVFELLCQVSGLL